MKNLFVIAFVLIFANFLETFSQSYIVKFKSEKSARNFIQSNKLEIIKIFPENYNRLINSIQSNNSFNPNLYYKITSKNAEEIHKLTQNEDIEYWESNHRYKLNQIKYNDSLFPFQWSLDLINARRSMNHLTGKGIKIAIIDSGIDFDHPDLKNQFYINQKEDLNQNGTFEPWDYREIRNGQSGDLNYLDDDGNGFADDVIGYDFVDLDFVNFGDWKNPDPIPTDEALHGTNVASIISAEGNNNIGMVGIANKAKILNVRAFDITGNGETDDIANAIIYSAIRGVDIINMSFGDYFNSHLLEDAIKYALSMGCILVASSGNDDKPDPHYPSDYKDVISVGSTNKSGKKSSFSNWGVNLALLAPGEEIVTCQAGGGYDLASGTSFSAPFVSGAIALFLENNPKPTSSEIRSHLEATAKKLSSEGWLFRSGAGLLDVSSFLESRGLSNIEINQIENYDALVHHNNLEISINAITPLFKRAQIEVAEINSASFVSLPYEFNKQAKNEKINVNLSDFKKDINLSLKVELNNGQFLRRQRAIRILNTIDSLKILFKQVSTAIKNGKRVILVSIRTNVESVFSVDYYHSNHPLDIFHKKDIDNKDRNHLIVLDDLILSGKYKIIGKVSPINNPDKHISTEFEIDFEPQLLSSQNVIQKGYTLPRSYLNNNVLDLYNKGTQQIVVNDLSNFVIENAKIYEFRENKFILLDTLEDWIPVAFGNVNGNNTTDILMTYNGKTQLTEAPILGQNPFGKEVYKSNFSYVEWGENLYDLDGDGLDEIIGYNDSSYFALKFHPQQNKFQVLARTSLPQNLRNKGLTKSSAISDFDGDGNPELIHSNYYGNVFVYQFNKKNNQFELKFVDSTDYGYSNPIIALIKNKNGENEAIIASFGTNNLFGENSSNDQIWSIKSIRKDNKANYVIKNIENIMGVRAGIDPRLKVGFRNGVVGADIDGDGQDELIVSTLPNTYVFKKNNDNWQPYWHYPYSFTNSAIVWDFDKNGKNEIGIATFDSTKFFELPSFKNVMSTPQFVDSYTLSNTIAIMKWTKVADAHYYRLYKIIQNDVGELFLQQISKTEFDSAIVIDLTPKNYHYFIVTAVDTSQGLVESNYSEILAIYANEPIQPVKVSIINNNTLVVSFNGKVKQYLENTNVFTLINLNSKKIEFPESIIANSDTSYILSFHKSIEQGEYEIICKPFRDYWNNISSQSSIYFEITNSPRIEEIYVKSLEIIDFNNYILEFSEPVELASATKAENYEFKPIGKVLEAKLDNSDLTKVLLITDDAIKNSNSIGETYSITAKNIVSINGKPITKGSGNTMSFTIIKDDVKSVFAFPNPVSLSKDEYIGFGNLPKNFEIIVMNLQGTEIHRLSDNNATGAVKWNLTDFNGNKLSIGTYIYKVIQKDQNGLDIDQRLNKFAVVP